MEIKIRTVQNEKISILELGGRFDAFEVPAVREVLSEMTDRSNAQVVINLGKVSFIDSSGLAVFVQGMKHCRQGNGDLHLCTFQKRVRIIFELSRLEKAFRIFESEEEAIAAFAG